MSGLVCIFSLYLHVALQEGYSCFMASYEEADV